MATQKMAFVPDTIKKSWEKSGILPFNPNIFTDVDFACSAFTSRHAHLPRAIQLVMIAMMLTSSLVLTVTPMCPMMKLIAVLNLPMKMIMRVQKGAGMRVVEMMRIRMNLNLKSMRSPAVPLLPYHHRLIQV